MIAIVKYNAGNVLSVQYALQRIGVDSIVTDDAYMNGAMPDNNNSKLKKSIDLFMII